MKYKKILMDADDTLFDFQAGNRRAVALLMEELGLSSPTVFDEYQAINHACWDALDRGEMTQEVLHVERFRRFLAAKNRSDDPRAVADRFAALLGMQALLYDCALDVVAEIAAHLPVVLLTNGITVIQKRRISLSPLKELISGMVISQELGVSKPDPRIYLHALNGMDPGDALMVGDSLKSDVLGANRAGIDACWFNPRGKALDGGVHAEYVIRDLRELPAIALQEHRPAKEVRFYPFDEALPLKFAVIFARHAGQNVYCRHRDRATWELPGGHIEPGETAAAAAARELREETGALRAELTPVCVYSVLRDGAESFGALFRAEIPELGPLEHEIAELALGDAPPGAWTYPDIQPRLLRTLEAL